MSDVYAVTRTLSDSINGIELYAGQYVETDEDAWVRRFGPRFLKPIHFSENVRGKQVVTISDTVEGSAAKEAGAASNRAVTSTESGPSRKPAKDEQKSEQAAPKRATTRSKIAE